MIAFAMLALAPVCVLGKVVATPLQLKTMIVNVANSSNKLLQMPPNPDGGFMLFLDPGPYKMRLVPAKGNGPGGPQRQFTVVGDKLNRVCVPSASLKPGYGRLEGVINAFPLVPSSKVDQVVVPPLGTFAGCAVTVTSSGGTVVKKLSAAVYGIFTADLKPGDYTLTTEFKGPNKPKPVKVTIKAGSLSSVGIPVDTGIR